VPLDDQSGDILVLRQRAACPVPENMVGPESGKEKVTKHEYLNQENEYEKEKAEHGITAGGYLIGRHRECGQSSPAHAAYSSLIDPQIVN
jgi:serine/threonine-protein kinase Chk2